jgi:hypothetical protein
MPDRTLRITVLIAAALWFAVVVPAHTRGLIRLPGAAEAGPTGGGCCESPSHAASDDSQSVPERSGTPTDPVRSCAICFLVAHLSSPPPPVIYTPGVTLIHTIAPEAGHQEPWVPTARSIETRGPPACSSPI